MPIVENFQPLKFDDKSAVLSLLPNRNKDSRSRKKRQISAKFSATSVGSVRDSRYQVNSQQSIYSDRSSKPTGIARRSQSYTSNLPVIRSRSVISNESNRSKLHSRASSMPTSLDLRRNNDPERLIKGWFSQANKEEQDMALKLLSAVSSLNIDNHSRSTGSRQSVQSHRCKCNVSRFSNHSRQDHFQFEDSSYPTNADAMAYNTNGRMIKEYIIHPEWCNRDQNSLAYGAKKLVPFAKKLTNHDKDEGEDKKEETNEIKIRYGYWRK